MAFFLEFMERCVVCGKKAKIKIRGNPSFCEECFCRSIEKRIRRYVRLNRIFSKNDRIYVKDDLCRYIVKSIIKDLPVRYTSRKKANKIVVKYTADDVCVEFLKWLFGNEKPKKWKKEEVRILLPVTDEEMKIFSKIKGIKFKPNKKDREIAKFLYSMQKRYPETIISLSKSAREIFNF